MAQPYLYPDDKSYRGIDVIIPATPEVEFLDPQKPVGGVKHDQGKDPWDLLPWDAVRAIVRVLKFGAQKYAARNWEQGMKWSRPFSAMIRHLTSWWEGESKDPETGYSHLWHAGCCVLFLIAYEIRGMGEDDRPSAKPTIFKDAA